jgi:hypothetical protein
MSQPFPKPSTLACMAFVALLATLPAGAASCGAAIELSGPMPQDARNMTLSNVRMSEWGLLTKSSFRSHKLPLALVVVTKAGPQQLSFGLSENVTRIRLALGTQVVYDGPAIKSLDVEVASAQALQVEFEWAGNDVRVAVSNFCQG